MNVFRWLVALALLQLTAGCSKPATDAQSADLILHSARVYSLNWTAAAGDGQPAADAPQQDGRWQPDAEAVVIGGDSIVFVGSNEEALKLRQDGTRVVDLAGATVIPGLTDSHTHVLELGLKMDRVDLTGARNEEEAVALVAARARTKPAGTWIVGFGWDDGAWADNYPDKHLLSDAVPDHPVLMRGLHGFADWGNQQALDVAGITADSEVPVGGEMRLGSDGQPNGLFLNRAVEMLRAAMPPVSAEDLRRRALLGTRRMVEDGYVAIHEAGLKRDELAAFEALERDGELPIRVYAMLSLRDEDLMREWIERGPDDDASSRLVTRSVKAYYDGALGSRGARMLEDYSDRPGHRGVSGDDYGFDVELMAEAIAAGFQIAIHAIGDAGNRETLDIFERIYADNPGARNLRHRIEHAQVLHPDDIPRLAALDLIASMEPPHAMEDKTWAEARIGPERLRGAYAWRSLREAGVRLTFNSDNPGSDHDIFYGLHSAVTRQDKSGQPEGGWLAHEAVGMEEAIRAYTDWSAYASFREQHTGIIELGRWADLTVLDVDPFTLADDDPASLLDGKVLMTVIGGEIAYER